MTVPLRLAPLSSSALLLSTALIFSATLTACGSARLEPASPDQKVAGRPNAAAADLESGVRVQVEAGAWMADDRVKDEVTAMKVTVINLGKQAANVDYFSFRLTSDEGKQFRALAPKEVPIRGATRSIGLPADTIVTRSSDSAVNAPNREISEKEQIRKRLEEQALRSGPLPIGERSVGYIFFERVPAAVKEVTFEGALKDDSVQLKFKPRQYR